MFLLSHLILYTWRDQSPWSISTDTNCCNWCPCQTSLHEKESEVAKEQFYTICSSEKRKSVCVSQSRGFLAPRLRSRSLCYSVNQPVIPVLPMWEDDAPCDSIIFSSVPSLSGPLSLQLPLHACLRDCCFSLIGPLFWLTCRASLLGMFTWIHASGLLANATPLFF